MYVYISGNADEVSEGSLIIFSRSDTTKVKFSNLNRFNIIWSHGGLVDTEKLKQVQAYKNFSYSLPLNALLA